MSFAFFPFHLFKVLPRDMHLCRSSSNVPHLPTLLKLPQNPHFFCALLARCRLPYAGHAKRHLNAQKCFKPIIFSTLLTSKFASGHNGMQFLNISSSKSAPRMVCFPRFYFEMCFPPQPRALFRHLNVNFQKRRDRQFLTLLTSKCASRHNSMHFFDISTSKSAESVSF